MRTKLEKIKLNNGVKIPPIGLGTWQIPASENLVQSIAEAIGLGFRYIDTAAIYENESALTPAAREITRRIWSVIAHAEARVHDACVEDVHFHEVGRMSNILAIGLIAEVFAAVNPIDFVCSPVPLGDGEVVCAHGVVTNPAPALLSMIDGVAVKPFAGEGEAVTPTGLAILIGLGARFDCWPQMRVRRHATAFHNKKVFNGCANGLLFALGDALQS